MTGESISDTEPGNKVSRIAVKPTAIEPEALYTTPELAWMLRVSVRTVEGWRARGKLPRAIRLFPGARPLYRGIDIIEALNRAARQAEDDAA